MFAVLHIVAMSHFILIINKVKTTWIPPRYGVYKIPVEQICLPEADGTMIHFCCDNCNRITYILDTVIPAIHALFPGGNGDSVIILSL